ncbi:MAG: hypothetical protein AB1634_18775, partial [Thermodesulfobacteriota bacterium]
MAEQDQTFPHLLQAYEGLSPLGQALMQLCSVIYEPTDGATILRCLRRSGLSFPREGVADGRALAAYLRRLQKLGLLDQGNRCHPAILETVTRRAMADGRLYSAGSLVREIENKEAWSDKGPATCLLCRGRDAQWLLRVPGGLLCQPCAAAQLEQVLRATRPYSWSETDLATILTGTNDLRQRLALLWDHAQMARGAGLRGPGERERFLKALVGNLGYDHGHPMDRAVRTAALEACCRLGSKVLPALLDMVATEPWFYYANLLTAVARIGPERPEVAALLSTAAGDPRRDVRLFVAEAAIELILPWSRKILVLLGRDADPAVKRCAAEGLSALLRVGRGHSTPVQSSRSQVAPGDCGPLVRAVHAELPLDRFGTQSTCGRLMREVRIGLYTADTALYHSCLKKLFATCDHSYTEPHPLVQVANRPFDPVWLGSLRPDLAAEALAQILYHAISELDDDQAALAYARERYEAHAWSGEDASRLGQALVCRLIMGGLLAEARALLPRLEVEASTAASLAGWLGLVEGKTEEARASFQAAIARRSSPGPGNALPGGLAGPFLVLGLLPGAPPALLARIGTRVGVSLALRRGPRYLTPICFALKAMLLVHSAQSDQARTIIAQHRDEQSPLVRFFFALATFLVEGRLSQEENDGLSRILVQAQRGGWHWLALECAELLRRTEEDTPVRRSCVEKIRDATGMCSLAAALPVEEAWRRSLRALAALDTSATGGPAGAEGATRLVWMLGEHNGAVALRPVEQKLSARGTWGKGRELSVYRLAGAEVQRFSLQDQMVCNLLYTTHYHARSAVWPQAMALLVGHPLVFLESSPSTPVEIHKSEPELLVTGSDAGITIRFSVPFQEERLVVVRETPARYRVIELSDEHRRIARILGNDGLTVPPAGHEQVLAALVGLSSHLVVHSTIGGEGGELEAVSADPQPHMHLLPYASGIRVEMFVKPFGDGGPYLKPGTGAPHLITEVKGRRLQTRRDLGVEERLAADLEAACPLPAGLEDGHRRWLITDPKECLEVLDALREEQEQGRVVVEWPEGETLRLSRRLSFSRLSLAITGHRDWFEVSGELRVDDELALSMK